ncbi:hypothetical protein G5V59_27400 [Nocardioides sp. W3-2-3]|uniref:hypothetical protein n=1 Tax=Nocardioides convexus TaxID=2712224 RepID=UPI0024181AF1|nr:hypothetical protein [Nocardioides convexus]NHA02109.1 hypothetical protein [Nocardioides convexus]
MAAVAEFEDDSEAVTALIAAATTGRFDHTLAQARQTRDWNLAKEALVKDLTDAGLTIIDEPGYPSPTKSLARLAVSAEDDTPLSEVEHEDCPGHVVWIGRREVEVDKNGKPVVLPPEPSIEAPDAPYDLDDHYWFVNEPDDYEGDDPRAGIAPDVLAAYDEAQAEYDKAVDEYQKALAKARAGSRRVTLPAAIYGCREWAERGHHDPHAYHSPSTSKPKASEMSEAEREEAKKARKVVIDNNKAWAPALDVRREYVANLAKAKTPPKGTQKFLATALTEDARLISDVTARHLAGDWLGLNAKNTPKAAIEKATDNRALVMTLIRVLAAYEAPLGGQFGRGEWRRDGTNNATGRYLRFLESTGYALSEVEKFAISKKTA